jgi:hypothetical protein
MFPNTAEGRKKAAGRCYGIYRNRKKAIDIIKAIKEDIVEIKSVVVNKVTTPPLKNIKKKPKPKVEDNHKKKKPCVK